MSEINPGKALLDWARGQDFGSTRQRTIERSVSFTGESLVDGRPVRVSLHPADPDTGLVFRRADLPNKPEIPARLENVCRSSIYVALTSNGRREGTMRKFLRGNAHRPIFRYLEHRLLPLPEPHVAVVEHFLAAAYLFVDNLIVEVDGDTLPYLEFGEYVRPYMEAGILRQEAKRKLFTLSAPYRAQGRTGQRMEIEPDDRLTVEYSVDFAEKSAAVGEQSHAITVTPETFTWDISRARSLFLVTWRRFVTDIYRGVDYSAKSLSKILVADGDSYLNSNRGPDAPRYIQNGASTELVRHKIGDLLGEMALTGRPLLGRFRIHRGGHDFILRALKEIIDAGLLREL
jgi:UDP-3-O-[3-hydroxymyristoyl] N-acetylglucosamine deacetylase